MNVSFDYGAGSASAARDAAYSASEGTGVSPKAALCAALMTLLPRLSAQELATALSGLSKLQVLFSTFLWAITLIFSMSSSKTVPSFFYKAES